MASPSETTTIDRTKKRTPQPSDLKCWTMQEFMAELAMAELRGMVQLLRRCPGTLEQRGFVRIQAMAIQTMPELVIHRDLYEGEAADLKYALEGSLGPDRRS